MTLSRCFIGAGFVLGFAVPWCVAQTPADQKTSVIQLAHVDCASIQSVLQSLNLPLGATCAGDDALIIHGLAPEVDRAVKNIVAKLDVPGSSTSERISAFIQLKNPPADNLLDLLRTVATSRHTRVAIDAANRLVIVRGEADEIKAMRDLIGEVDYAAQSLTAHLYFLSAERAGGENGELPSALAPVAKTLAENGFGACSLMGPPVIVTTHEGRGFKSQSVLATSDGGGEGELAFAVEGAARFDEQRNMVQLDVEILVKGQYGTTSDAPQTTTFNAETTIVAKLDTYVILAAAPASTSAGDAIAVAVRLTRN